MKKLLLFFFCLSCFTAFSQTHYMLVGTYTNKGSKGIYVYRFNTKRGSADSVSCIESSNPSYLAVSPGNNYVYAVNENTDTAAYMFGGGVSSFSFDNKTGKLNYMNSKSSEGKHPCYITVDKTGKWLITGNYTSGNIVTYALKNDGSIDTLRQIIQHTGSSINAQRQQSAHVHSTVLDRDNHFLYTADLGNDTLNRYFFDSKTGLLSNTSMEFASVSGSGPRHFVFSLSEEYIYLLEELTGTLQVIRKNWKTGLEHIQRISTHPEGFSGKISSADIHISPDGNFIYCSNRGESNTIAIFKINKNDGTVSAPSFQSTLGLTPRNFSFDPTGKYLLVANQNSNSIVVFKRNRKNGLLKDTGKRITVPGPVCIKWIY